MTNVALWALALSILTPLATSLIQQPRFSRNVRIGIAAAVSVVVGAGTAYFSGDLTGKSLVVAIGIVLVGAEATYQKVWRPSGLAPAIENATSPTPVPQSEDGSYDVSTL